MKNLMVVSVLSLVLLFALVGPSFATSQPYDYHELTTPDGDDHPWGGEQYSTETPLKASQSDRFPVITAFGSLDLLFGVYLEIFYPQPRPVTKPEPSTKTTVQATPLTSQRGSATPTTNRGY